MTHNTTGKGEHMQVKKCEDVPNKPVQTEGAQDVSMRLLLSKEDGARNFVMRMFEIGPGGHTPYHSHDWEHEIFVLEGKGIVSLEGQDYPLSAGDVFLVPEGSMHQFRSAGPQSFRFLCLVPPRGQA